MSAEKAPKKKKIPKIKELKKRLIVGVIITIIAITGIVSGIIIFRETPKGGTCKLGISILYGIDGIDPLQAYFQGRIVVDQVAETLFENELFGEESRIIYNLATGYDWSNNTTELTCYLREDVKFHDETPFNATAVKWNFDRIHNLINICSWADLFYLPDGSFVINKTEVLNDFTIKFVLNAPFVPFLSLLTHSSTAILSPASTPPNEFIHPDTGDLIGTGPFLFDRHEPLINVTMSANSNYWGAKPHLDNLVFNIFSTFDDHWNALLAKNISMLDPWFFVWGDHTNHSIESLKNNPDFTVQETIGSTLRYIGMNCTSIPVEMRKAISYAVNYSGIIETVRERIQMITTRARSPIPEGILHSNITAFDVPEYNISKARQILKDVNWNNTAGALTADNNVSVGNDWEKLVDIGKPLANYKICNFPWQKEHAILADLVKNNLKQIGINVSFIGWHEPPWDLFVTGWGLDYNDPHTIALLYSSKYYNEFEINDVQIDLLVEKGLNTTDFLQRKQIYYQLQEILIEDIYPMLLIYTKANIDVYVSNLKGWKPDLFKNQFKTVYFV